MNPAKISKMDEEVAKWSRKDPSAIKKAMVCPGIYEYILCPVFMNRILYSLCDGKWLCPEIEHGTLVHRV
jgi:hypothetical protein